MTNQLMSLREFEQASRKILADMMEEQDRTRYFYMGYTREEESQWRLFNRCCHPGNDIRIKERPVMIRAGKPSVAFRPPQPTPPPRI